MKNILIKLIPFLRAVLVGFRTGFIEMMSHKLRSFLSLLGVMLGVGALVAMLTVVGGVDDFMEREMGSFAGRVGMSDADPPEDNREKLAWSRSPGFRFSDASFLEQHVPEVASVFKTIMQRSHMAIGNQNERIRTMGTNADHLASETNVFLKTGRFFKEKEYQEGLAVCVLSWRLEERLLKAKGLDPAEQTLVGEKIGLFGKQFHVIGVFELKNKMFRRWHYERLIYMPIKAMQRYVSGYNPDPGFITIEVSDVKNLEDQIAQIGHQLARHHRSVEDFEFHVFNFLEEFMQLLRNVNILFGFIAAASMLVGGLGIMNVMLSSISERIREIGIRKALGASSTQVFVQFLTETVTLSLTGGSVGALIGALPVVFADQIYEAINHLIRPQLHTSHLFLVLFVVVFIGVVFGMYPAVKASRLNPIDALRYE